MNATTQTESAEFRELVRQLVDVLGLHATHHRALADVLGEKKTALVDKRFDDLQKTLDLEREAIGAIGAVEEERVRVTQEIARHLGKPRGALVRVRELVAHVDDEFREELLDLRDELRSIAADIERLNRMNRTLSVLSLDHVNLYIAMLAGRDPDARTYDQTGGQSRSADSVPSLVLDRRI